MRVHIALACAWACLQGSVWAQSGTTQPDAEAWRRAQQWAQSPTSDDLTQEVAVVGLDGWQLFYFRNNTWSNPLSSAGNEAAGGAGGVAGSGTPGAVAANAAPDGIRLVLRLATDQPISGELTRDWMQAAPPGGP